MAWPDIIFELNKLSPGSNQLPERQAQELKGRIGLLMSQFSAHEKPSFKPIPDDVIISIPPKNGTTWLMHICHQIRMKGQEPDFEDQLEVITRNRCQSRYKTIASKATCSYLVDLYSSTVSARPRRRETNLRLQESVISAYHFLNSALSLS